MKILFTIAFLLTATNALADLSTARLDWMSVTCAELQTTIQNHDLTVYGNSEYFNKNLMPFSERDAFCQDWEKDFRVEARAAVPVKTTDKRGFFNLCSVGRIAFKCVDKVEH